MKWSELKKIIYTDPLLNSIKSQRSAVNDSVLVLDGGLDTFPHQHLQLRAVTVGPSPC